MKVGIIGAGRIGKVHAKNISLFVPEMEIKAIADPFMDEETEAFARSRQNSRRLQGRRGHFKRSGDRGGAHLLLHQHPCGFHPACRRPGEAHLL